MEHSTPSGTQGCDASFAARVRKLSGINVDRCYQCMTCSLGCPVSSSMDVQPNQIVRLTQLGLKDEVLQSSAIWICASCECCVTRCPNEIDIPRLMDILHQIALQDGVPVREPSVPVFHRVFLLPVKRFGRQFEVMMTALFILKAKKFSLKDMITNATLGLSMLSKGKLKFVPPSIRGTKALREIFQKTEGNRHS